LIAVKRFALAAAFVFTLLFAAGSKIAAAPANQPLKIAFVMSGPITDYGYNYAQNVGRIFLQSHMKNVETTMIENVPENEVAERVMEKLIAQGNRLLFSTSYGYLEPAERVAKRHPDVFIVQGFRESTLPNLGSFAARLYEPLYVVGMVAGKLTKKNNIGIVCAHPIPVTIQNVNAIALGARLVNPKVKVHVVWTSSWSDPPTEAEATKELIGSGVDVIGSELSNPLTVARTAEQQHAMSISNQTDLRAIVPNGWLTGSRWNWGPTFCAIAESVQKHTMKTGLHWLGLKDGTVALCSFGKIVPAKLQAEATSLAQEIEQGKKNVFTGPLKDREGKQHLGAGQVGDSNFLADMNWFVPGVEGPLPKR